MEELNRVELGTSRANMSFFGEEQEPFYISFKFLKFSVDRLSIPEKRALVEFHQFKVIYIFRKDIRGLIFHRGRVENYVQRYSIKCFLTLLIHRTGYIDT